MTSMKNLLNKVKENPSCAFDEILGKINHSEKSNYNIYVKSLLSSVNFKQIFPKILEQKKGKELFGLTFGVKDIFAVKGQAITAGLNIPIGAVNRNHAKLVENLINRGASIAGITNLDAFELDFYGRNSIYGNVVNPNFKSLISGGSSAGSAAGVAADYFDFGIGSDSGGSVRIPAACCGIVGYIGSEKFLSRKGMFKSTKSFSMAGLLTKNIEDLKIIIPELECDNKNKNYKIFIPKLSELKELVDKEVFIKFENILKLLKQNFILNELDFELEFKVIESFKKIIIATEVSEHIEAFGLNFTSLSSTLKALFTFNKTNSKDTIKKAYEALNDYKTQKQEFFKESFLLTPTLGSKVPENNGKAGSNFSSLLSFSNTCNFPSISFPLKEKEAGNLPYSLQLVGGKNRDLELINLASQISSQSYDC
jgi:amidase